MNDEKSWVVRLIEKGAGIILAIAILIAVCKANSVDIPTIIKTLAEDGIIWAIGWIVALVVFVICFLAVCLLLWKNKDE